jgi:hypothetical protein
MLPSKYRYKNIDYYLVGFIINKGDISGILWKKVKDSLEGENGYRYRIFKEKKKRNCARFILYYIYLYCSEVI